MNAVNNEHDEDFFDEIFSLDFTQENKTLNERVKRRTVVGPWKHV